MRDYQWVRVERENDGVRVLSLDKPPVNALGRAMVGKCEGDDVELRSGDVVRSFVIDAVS